jgi:hypothetical protein
MNHARSGETLAIDVSGIHRITIIGVSNDQDLNLCIIHVKALFIALPA